MTGKVDVVVNGSDVVITVAVVDDLTVVEIEVVFIEEVAAVVVADDSANKHIVSNYPL